MRGYSKRPGFEWEQSVADHHRTVIAPGIEECFDALPSTDEHLIIDSIDIDLGVFTHESFVKEARERLVRLLGECLQECGKKAAASRATSADEITAKATGSSIYEKPPLNQLPPERVLSGGMVDGEALLCFLEEGVLPWWFTGGERLFKVSIFNQHLVSRLSRLLLEDEAAMIRAVNHFTDEMMLAFLKQCGRDDAFAGKEWEMLATVARKYPQVFPVFRQRFWMEKIYATREMFSGQTIVKLFTTFNKEFVTDIYSECQKDKAFEHYTVSLAPLAENKKEQLKRTTQEEEKKHSKKESASDDVADIPKRKKDKKQAPVNPPEDKHITDGNTGEQLKHSRQHNKETQDTPSRAERREEETPHFPVAKKITLDEAVYVEAAGLVLLHPFLSELFSSTGLWKNNEWVSPGAPFRAVQLMSFLTYGAEEVPEYRLAFHKILAGMDVTTPLPAEAPLLPEETATCTELLEAVLSHWTALRNTGVDGLREGFLVRNGKVEQTPKGIRLDVERLAQDVLLARLPWGYSTVKLPWLEPLLVVNWM